VRDTFEHIVNTCSKQGENRCGISNILKNGQKSVFKLVHASESVVQTVKDFHPKDSDELYEDMNELGAELAETLVAILDV